jgi:hypothetical protein
MSRFSKWLPWNERLDATWRYNYGVYLLAQFEDGHPESVETGDKRILLIAETHGQTLERRWDQFHYSAFKGGNGHSGGRTFRKLFANGPDVEAPSWLFVSASPVPSGAKHIQASVLKLKKRLLAEYKARYGVLPRCNTTGPAESDSAITETSNARYVSRLTPAPPLEHAEEPPITFSKWWPWSERKQIPGREFAGIYALSCFDNTMPKTVDVLDECVVYIGETCENSLSGRLEQFNRSAFIGKNGHSGGWSYRSRRADTGKTLYVSVLPISTFEEPRRSSFIRHVERKLLWGYVSRWGRRPLCNSK